MNEAVAVSTLTGKATRKIRACAPGLLLTVAVALASIAIAGPLGVSSIAIALLVGAAFAPATADPRWTEGVEFSARPILRLGVALLGAQITFGQIMDLGTAPVAIAIAGLGFSLIAGLAIARTFGANAEMAIVSASAVAICGASAALAVAAVLPRTRTLEHSVAVTIACITLVGTVGMLAYPFIGRLLEMTDAQAGLFLGATLQEVVQAVGGGFAFSNAAGETATTVKLIRVACLGPVVLAIGYWAQSNARGEQRTTPLLPLFLLGFMVMVVAGSFGLLGPTLTAILSFASRLFLTMAMVALGLRISLPSLMRTGGGAILIVLAQSLALAGFVLLAIWLVWP